MLNYEKSSSVSDGDATVISCGRCGKCFKCRVARKDPRYARKFFGDPAPPRKHNFSLDCSLRGAATSEVIPCKTCGGRKDVPVYSCALHGRCTTEVTNAADAPKWCRMCEDKVAPLTWAYGVTTVESRRGDLLPRTLASLAAAGFDKPHLFVDGGLDSASWQAEFKLDVTCRYPNVRTAGHWHLSAMELYLRNPNADRYALFQDDMVTYRNLRQYLEASSYPERGYCNLYTFPSNQKLANGRQGWYKSNQFGRGAVALVFDNTAVQTLLVHNHMVKRAKDANRGYKAIDGGIVTALAHAGYSEYVHNPSLVQHTGEKSSMGNLPHQLAESFRGETFDAMELLCK